MGRRNDHSREELKDLALRAAADIVDNQGATALSMREVARNIGYTVGALYLVFTNLDDLIVHVNERTVIELRNALEKIRGKNEDPRQSLRLLVAAYLGFALLRTARWRLVFEHRLPQGQPAPPTYSGHTAALFAMVAEHLRACGVRSNGHSLDEISTALWSGVHGACMLAVTGKLQVGTESSVQRLFDVLLDRFLTPVTAARVGAKRTSATRVSPKPISAAPAARKRRKSR
jgi:AcrR family transcriptional regulator